MDSMEWREGAVLWSLKIRKRKFSGRKDKWDENEKSCEEIEDRNVR